MRKNCIHSIKYKYLTVTMYLRYLLISNIKSKKWLEGPNQKLSASVIPSSLSIYISAMYITHTHTHFCCKMFFSYIQDYIDCKSHFFAVFIKFDFCISLCIYIYECMNENSTFYPLDLRRFFSALFVTFIFITNCRRYSFRACLDPKQQQDKPKTLKSQSRLW